MGMLFIRRFLKNVLEFISAPDYRYRLDGRPILVNTDNIDRRFFSIGTYINMGGKPYLFVYVVVPTVRISQNNCPKHDTIRHGMGTII
jgi:hypothetical protein